MVALVLTLILTSTTVTITKSPIPGVPVVGEAKVVKLPAERGKINNLENQTSAPVFELKPRKMPDYETPTNEEAKPPWLQPDLFPYQPSGWSAPLVISQTLYDSTATPAEILTPGDTAFVMWAIANGGSADVTDTCYFGLYRDDSLIAVWYTTSLPAGYYVPMDSFPILEQQEGQHVYRITADITDYWTESDETNNSYENTWTWQFYVNLAPYTPPGWNAPLVISDEPNDTTASSDVGLTPADTAYLHWAIANFGNTDIVDTFYVTVYRDGVALATWVVPDGLPSGYYAYYLNYPVYEPAEGAHIYKVTADPDSLITESDETDNSYEDTFTWGTVTTPTVGDAEYMIITTTDLKPFFQPLCDWKNQKGIKTRIVTLDWIYANYTGRDNAEKIRNFIIDAHNNWGTSYILLGGQCDWENGQEIVPRRDAYVFASNAGYYSDEDTIITDLYFADLDGTWDADGDGVYGEIGDNVDMYPDVYVGRAPVLDSSQVINFVNKVLTYEKEPDTSYIRTAYYPQGNLWTTNHGTYMNDTMAQFNPPYWIEVYQREDIEGISEAVVNSELNKGYHLCHMVGHGNEVGVYYNYGYNTMMNNSDADVLSNPSDRLTIYNSIACFSGAFDEVPGGDCFAEHLMNNKGSGAVAVLFNSRYGWGDSSEEGALGASGEQSKYFYQALFEDGIYILGQTWAQMQSYMVPAAASSQYYRWALYERNLLGDPTMWIWTATPTPMTIILSQYSIPINTDVTINVTVNTAAKAAVSDAIVTLVQKYSDDSLYLFLVDTTDINGTASFTINTSITSPIFITAVKPNYLYAQDTVTVSALGVDENTPSRPFKDIFFGLKSNIVKDHITLTYSTSSPKPVSVNIWSVDGRKVKSIEKISAGGREELTVNTAKMKAGVYFITIKIGEKRFKDKFILTR